MSYLSQEEALDVALELAADNLPRDTALTTDGLDMIQRFAVEQTNLGDWVVNVHVISDTLRSCTELTSYTAESYGFRWPIMHKVPTL